MGRQGAGALRAGDGQCGAVPAAAEAACGAGGPLPPAGDSARLTPCSSALSSSSALRLRLGGPSEDAGLAGRAPLARAPPPANPAHPLVTLLARGRPAALTGPASRQQRRASPGARARSLRAPSIVARAVGLCPVRSAVQSASSPSA